LCESTTVDDELSIIIGIGINVNMLLELLEKIDRPATSLMVECGTDVKVERVLNFLQNRFVTDLEFFLRKGISAFIDEYRSRIVNG